MAAENGVVNEVNEDNKRVAVREPTTIVPVTAAIYHNGQEKPTERWSLELGLTLSEDKHLSTIIKRLEKGYGVKNKTSALGIRSYLSGQRAGSSQLIVKSNGRIAFRRFLVFSENL